MKFYCDTDKLNSALSLVSRAVEANAVSPHLEGVLLKADGGTLNLKGSNSEISIETAIPSNVAEKGEIVINSKMLCDIAKKLPNDVVEFVLGNNNVCINCLNSDYTVVGLPSDEYPDIPEVNSTQKIKIQASVLKSIINKTIFAVSTNPDEPRKVLKGALFEIEENTLTMVCVDLYRLATVKKELLEYDGENMKFVVPGKTLNEIKNMLPDDDETTVTICVDTNKAVFECPSFKLTTRLIDGEYFSYKQIIPKQFKNELSVNTRLFVKTIERVEPIIDNVSKNPIKLTFTDGKIKIKCETRLGRVNDFLECGFAGDELVIGFNYRYIHDAVVRCEDENMIFKFNSPLNPVIIVSEDDDSYLFMVLPVRL